MIRGMSALFMVLVITIMTATVDAQAQSASSTLKGSASTGISDLLQDRNNINKIQSDSATPTSISVTGNETSKDNGIKILGIDSTSFPKMKVNIFIDKFCAIAGNLKKENFKVKEDDKDTAIDNFYFTGNASGQKLDLAVVFDDTGSMGEEISAMKSKVKDLTDTLKASGINANYALVSFKDSVSVKTNWTDDPEVFKKYVDALHQTGGDDEPEVSLDAIEAVLAMDFRPDAQKIILVITDAHAHYKDDGSTFSSRTKEEIKRDLKGSGAIFIPISPTFDKSSSYVDLREISNDIQSMWIDINSADFSTILEQFQGILTGTYVIEYTSPDQTPAENRTVLVLVDAPGCVEGSASSSYTTPGSAPAASNAPPVINNLRGVNWLNSSHYMVGKNISWHTDASDPDGDQVLYRFFLNNEPMTDWTSESSWTWTPNEAGSYQVEVQVRDGKHAGPNGYDDIRSDRFDIQASVKSWDKTFGGPAIDWGRSVQQTSDGGYIITGVTASYGAGDDDVWLIKTDADGNKLWDKTFGGPNYDGGNSAQQTSDGGYIITGVTDSYGAGGDDVWLIKTDADGNKLWDKTFGGPNCDGGKSAQQTSDGGYIISGYTDSIESGGKDGGDVWLIKTDADGNKLWDKTFSGPNDDVAYVVQQTNDGGYIIIGSAGSGDLEDNWLIKTDSNGNKLWDKTFGISEGQKTGGYNAGQQTNDGGYIIASSYFDTENDPSSGFWVIKTDANGNILWDKKFEGSMASCRSVRQTSDDGYIIAGEKTDDVWLIKTDADGNKIWDRTFGGGRQQDGNFVQQTNDGGYIVAGTKFLASGDGDFWIIKTDTNGDVRSDADIYV